MRNGSRSAPPLSLPLVILLAGEKAVFDEPWREFVLENGEMDEVVAALEKAAPGSLEAPVIHGWRVWRGSGAGFTSQPGQIPGDEGGEP